MKLERLVSVLIISIISLNISLGQSVVFPLIKELKGNPKSIKETKYKAVVKAGVVMKGIQIGKSSYLLDTKSQLLEKDDYDSTGTIVKRYVANYDNMENPLEEMLYTPDSVISKFKYRYDNKNNRIGWMSFTIIDTAIARGSYHYDDKGRITTDSLFDAKGRLSKCSGYTFDEQDRLTKESSFCVHGDKTIDNYEFDMDGNRIQDTRTGTDGSTKCVLRFRCNSDGKLLQTDIITDSNDTYLPFEKFKYDNEGKKTEDAKFSGGKMVFREELAYDSLATIISDAVFGPDDKPIEKRTCLFDSKHNKTEEAIFKTDTLFEKHSYKFDNKKNRTEIKTFKAGETIKALIEYDRLGNPVKETAYSNDQPVTITEREIVYY
jgi:hypothetical protein